jgi:hypothetical protein
MGNTTITLNKEYFTVETSKAFLKDMEMACKTMELDVFTKLFTKYVLSFVEDNDEVLGMVKSIMSSWNKPNQGTELLEVTQFDSKCLFCEFGKTVKIYKWSYQHKQASIPTNRLVYESQIAFFSDFEDNHLIEFDVCNGYLDKNEMNLPNS